MRRVFNSFVAVAVVVMLTGSVAAAPRDRERPKEKVPAIVKMLKSIVGTLGDGLTIPKP
ncbi:MAG TPA: hypothetical protein VND45_17455 [Thermoanaerobaculia bacterium]|jgi:hypothetical protein|nr:hypothetical protein [Thermoanaerobaculia bacterium]